MSHKTVFDPRSQITHPIDEGQVYEDSRTGDELVLVFCSDDVALLRDDDGHHRLEPRDAFEEHVGAGRYELRGDGGDATSSTMRILTELREQYDSSDGRKAAHKSEALSEAIELIENNGRPDDNETIPYDEIEGIGTTAARELQFAGFRTKGDVRAANRTEIEEVPYMGSKNTSNLLDYVEVDG